jgi:lysophospholipase L1-like esterase
VRIAFLGDSLTEGSPGASYFRLLKQRLTTDELFNHGRAGDSVADLYARLQHTGLEPVDLAFVWIGANDAAVGAWASWAIEAFEPVTWATTLDHIATVYRRLLAWALERAPVAICVPPAAPDGLEGAWERRVDDLAEVVAAAVSAEDAAVLLDLAPWFAEARAGAGEVRFTIDGVHLSQAGAEVVAAAFETAARDRRP